MVAADKVAAIRAKAEALAGQSLGENGGILVEMAAERACAYCQRDDIPTEMEQAVAQLALSLHAGEGGGPLKTIQRGDTVITYDTANAALKSVESLLSPFRRLGRVR